MSRRLWFYVALPALAVACDSATSPTTPREPATARPRADGWADVTYPLHMYGDETDSWAYITSTAPAYVEMVAADQTPNLTDGTRVCPNDQLIMRNAHLRMEYHLETLDFDFRGPFNFVRYVSTQSPYPTAVYQFSRNAYTRDNKYYAPAGGTVLLACDGRYVVNNDFLRVWVGQFYGKAYNGPIVLNPDYEGDRGEGGCGDGTEDMYEVTYSPYEDGTRPGGGENTSCSGGSGSGIQFHAGDYTNGETVTWSGGVGDGGISVCGQAARVEQVCIDYWVDGVGWVEWSCGYATTC